MTTMEAKAKRYDDSKKCAKRKALLKALKKKLAKEAAESPAWTWR